MNPAVLRHPSAIGDIPKDITAKEFRSIDYTHKNTGAGNPFLEQNLTYKNDDSYLYNGGMSIRLCHNDQNDKENARDCSWNLYASTPLARKPQASGHNDLLDEFLSTQSDDSYTSLVDIGERAASSLYIRLRNAFALLFLRPEELEEYNRKNIHFDNMRTDLYELSRTAAVEDTQEESSNHKFMFEPSFTIYLHTGKEAPEITSFEAHVGAESNGKYFPMGTFQFSDDKAALLAGELLKSRSFVTNDVGTSDREYKQLSKEALNDREISDYTAQMLKFSKLFMVHLRRALESNVILNSTENYDGLILKRALFSLFLSTLHLRKSDKMIEYNVNTNVYKLPVREELQKSEIPAKSTGHAFFHKVVTRNKVISEESGANLPCQSLLVFSQSEALLDAEGRTFQSLEAVNTDKEPANSRTSEFPDNINQNSTLSFRRVVLRPSEGSFNFERGQDVTRSLEKGTRELRHELHNLEETVNNISKKVNASIIESIEYLKNNMENRHNRTEDILHSLNRKYNRMIRSAAIQPYVVKTTASNENINKAYSDTNTQNTAHGSSTIPASIISVEDKQDDKPSRSNAPVNPKQGIKKRLINFLKSWAGIIVIVGIALIAVLLIFVMWFMKCYCLY